MINYLRLFHAAYFTPFGFHPIERDAEGGEVTDWGARILCWGPPGGGKTSKLRQLARRMQVICFIMDSTFGEGALGVTPVPDFERNVLRFMRAEFFEIFDGQPGGVFCVDDMTTFAPALQPYLLGMLLNKRIGAHYLPAKVRVFGAANEPLDAPGCLSADTMIRYGTYDAAGRRSSTHAAPIAKLYQLFNRPGDKFVYKVSSINEETKELSLNTVTNVVLSGEKMCFEVRTASGLSIKATAQHQFFTERGYVRLNDLRVGQMVYTHQNTVTNSNKQAIKTPRTRVWINAWQHPHGVVYFKAGLPYRKVRRSRLVVEAAKNKLSFEAFVYRLNHGDVAGLVFLPLDEQVHHIDGNHRNDTLSNLEVLRAGDHAKHHSTGSLRYCGSLEEIVSIECVGAEMTYDICMAAPFHNFVAEKFVVHNSWELANAVKNRPCHIQLPDASIEDWCAGLSRGFNRCDEVVDAEAEEARVLAAFPNAWARAVGYMCGFSMVRRELHRQVEMDGNPLPNAYYTPRTKEFATIALASSYVHGLNSGTTDEFIGGYVGNAFASEFSTYRRAMDLPDPAAFLDGLTSFEHTSSRIDRSSAMMHACCTILEPRDAPKRVDRGKAFVKFLESIGDDSLDSVADIVTTRLFDMNIMESLQGADKGLLRRLRPLLELAEKAKKDVYA